MTRSIEVVDRPSVATPDAAASATSAPKLVAPPGACDCHIHIYGRPEQYPLAPTRAYSPQLATPTEYRSAVMRRLGIDRVVIVQPAAYGEDNSCTLAAIAEFGAVARGIAVVTPRTSAAELEDLSRRGVVGARFFMLRGSVMTWRMLESIAARIAPLGWHVQLQFDGRELPKREVLLRRLPCPVVIDHNGKFLTPVEPEHDAVRVLLQLMDTGRFWVKASAPYETSAVGPPLYDDVGAIARTLISNAPERVVWATNWPHGGRDTRPDDAVLLDVLLDWAPNDAVRHRILVDNPAELYGFST